MTFKKGESGNPAGKKRGTRNKIPGTLKERVLETWEELRENGQGLTERAKLNPDWFYMHFVKPMLPKDVDIKTSGDITIEIVRYGQDEDSDST